jgi:hypothetical protein
VGEAIEMVALLIISQTTWSVDCRESDNDDCATSGRHGHGHGPPSLGSADNCQGNA